MRESEIMDYAKGLINAHGDVAEWEAQQKAKNAARAHKTQQANDWQRIRNAIHTLRMGGAAT